MPLSNRTVEAKPKHHYLCAIAALLPLLAPTALAARQLMLTANVNSHGTSVRKVPLKQADDAFQLDLQYENRRYRLCPSDVIVVTFPHAPAFDQTVTIQPDGFATLAQIGDIRLASLTIHEAAESIRSSYARVLDEAAVAIELKEFKKPYFIVTGEVNKPGKYDMRGFTSVTEALAVAGGFNGAAKRSLVLWFRRAGNEWYEVKPLNLKRLFEGRDVSEDVVLRPGDMLVVPTSALSRVKRFIP